MSKNDRRVHLFTLHFPMPMRLAGAVFSSMGTDELRDMGYGLFIQDGNKVVAIYDDPDDWRPQRPETD